MTVKELAAYLKLSEMMIYKLAQNGEIPASKIGSAWRFSQGEIDKWLIGQRERSSWLTGQAKTVVENFVKDLKNEFGDNLGSVIIFGSYARGEAEEGSDLDIFIALKEIDDYWKTKDQIEDIAYSNTFEKNIRIVMAPVLMTEAEYLTENTPLLLNIRKEGRRAA